MTVMAPESFYLTPQRDVVEQTLSETAVSYEVDLGGGTTLYFGTRYGAPVWIVDNPGGLSPIWYDETA